MNFDLAAFLQTLHLPPNVVTAVMHVTSTLFALIMLVRTFRTPIVKGLTWAVDRFDDMAAHGREDGAILLGIVDSRAYKAVWFLSEYLLRLHLPTRASLEARWDKIEKEKEGEAEKDVHPNLDGTGLRSFAALLLLVPFLFAGCAALDPGADPVVVRVEQTSTIAKGTFDLVLHTDHSARAFWKEKAPAFHEFCEELRTPTQVDGITLPRCSAALWSLDRIKRDYQAAAPPDKGDAKARVERSLAALAALTTQANAWLVIVTNQPAAPSR